MKKYETITVKRATEDDYAAITSSYTRNEHDMLDNTIRDMRGCDFRLVEEVGGIAVHRKKTDLNRILE
jgi:hypothetical protein